MFIVKSVQISKVEENSLKLFRKLPLPIKKSIIKPINFYRIKQINSLLTPKFLLLYVTDNCNLRCKHCFYWKEIDEHKDALSLESIEKISKSLAERLDLLALTGGEPFVRSDIVEIVKAFVKNNNVKRVHIASNGFLTDKIEEKVKEMLSFGDYRLTLQFSIDGLKSLHNELRGVDGSFERVCETVKRLNKIDNKRLAVSVATVVMKKNFSQIRELKKFVNNELGVSMKFNILRKTGNVKGVSSDDLMDLDIRNSDYEVPTDEQLSELLEIVDDGSISSLIEKKKIEVSIDVLKGKKRVNCLAGLRDGVIFSNGLVSICEPIKAFADLKDYDYDFDKLWNSSYVVEKRKKFIGKCYCMNSCNLMNALQYDTEVLANL